MKQIELIPSLLRITLITIFASVCFITGCFDDIIADGEEGEEEETSLDIGQQSGDSITRDYAYYEGEPALITVTITPYTNGLKVFYQPVSSVFVCSLDNYVLQDSNQYEMGLIADNESDYKLSGYYKGYIESGTFTSCGDYLVDTTWVVFADKVGFDASRNYQVALFDLDEMEGGDVPFEINLYK